MTLTGVAGAAVAGVIVAAGVAVAANFSSSHHTDFFSSGRHQFYVWCAGDTDYVTIEHGNSAEDAQMRLYNEVKQSGKTNCWPVWQGRVPG